MKEMFVGASSFEQTLCRKWCHSRARNTYGMFRNSPGRICKSTMAPLGNDLCVHVAFGGDDHEQNACIKTVTPGLATPVCVVPVSVCVCMCMWGPFKCTHTHESTSCRTYHCLTASDARTRGRSSGAHSPSSPGGPKPCKNISHRTHHHECIYELIHLH